MRISDWSSDVCSSDLLVEHTITREIAEKVVIVRTIEDEAAVVDDIAGKAALGPARAELEVAVAFGAHVALEHAGQHQPAVGDDRAAAVRDIGGIDRSEEHTSELQSLMRISTAVF